MWFICFLFYVDCGLQNGKDGYNMAELKGAELIKENTLRRLTVRIGALEKEGKSTWALTAPPDIAYFDLNNRAEHVLNRFVGRGIYHYKYNKLLARNQKEWQGIWDKFQKDFAEAVSSKKIRSLVIDTDNDLWEVRRLAQWGRESSVPDQYGALNKDFRNLHEALLSADKNLVVITEKKKKYMKKVVTTKTGAKRDMGEWDGTYEMGGWSGTGFKVQTNLEIEFDKVQKTFRTRVINCGLNPFLVNREYEGAFCNFPCLAVDVFPDTDPNYWGYDEFVAKLGEEGE